MAVRKSVCYVVVGPKNFNKKRPTIMRFSPNDSPRTLVFSVVKVLLLKFDGNHPSETITKHTKLF